MIFGINQWPILCPCVDILPYIPKCSSMMAMEDTIGHWIYFVDTTSSISLLMQVIMCFSIHTTTVQTWILRICMVIQEWTGQETMETSSFHHPHMNSVFVKTGEDLKLSPQKITQKYFKKILTQPLPTVNWHQTSRFPCRYSTVKNIGGGRDWTYKKIPLLRL